MGLRTSQLLAVIGTRDHIQPSLDGRSAVSRTYLSLHQFCSSFAPVSHPYCLPFASLDVEVRTYQSLQAHLLQNPTTDSAYPSPSMAIPY